MDDGNVVVLNLVTRLDIPAPRVVEAMPPPEAWEHVVICGYLKDSNEFYFASSYAKGPDVVWALELAKYKLFHLHNED